MLTNMTISVTRAAQKHAMTKVQINQSQPLCGQQQFKVSYSRWHVYDCPYDLLMLSDQSLSIVVFLGDVHVCT